jgi:hypothetical protein
MGNLVNAAFAELKTQAGKKRLAFLLIDEAEQLQQLDQLFRCTKRKSCC